MGASKQDDENRANRFDLFFSVNDKANQKRYIHFLFEHKSNPDDFLILDFQRYIALAYKKILKKSQQPSGPILPILFIQTAKPWDPPSLEILLDLSSREVEHYREYLPDQKIATINLYGDLAEKLDFRKFLHFMIFVMHHIRSNDFEDKLEYALRKGGRELFFDTQNGVDRKRILFYYLIKSILKSRRERVAEVIEESLTAEVSEEFLTIAEWERREGKLEGKMEGKLEGKLEDARLMKEKGLELALILEITGLTEAQLKEHGIIE